MLIKVKVFKQNMRRCCQMQWYSIATSLVPNTTPVIPAVGKILDKSNTVDFYIGGDKKWFVTFLFEGDGLQEQLDRFKNGGVYTKLPYDDYLIIDIRRKMEKPILISNDHYWCIVLEEGLLITQTVQFHP